MLGFLTCPVCGFRMGKELFRREGFECPRCRSFLHLDERYSYIAAALCAPLALFISYIAGLDGLAFVLGTAVAWALLLALCGVGAAYYFPKLAVGLPPHDRVILHIPPADDQAREQTEQPRERGEAGADPSE
jgi:hypothetical protein